MRASEVHEIYQLSVVFTKNKADIGEREKTGRQSWRWNATAAQGTEYSLSSLASPPLTSRTATGKRCDKGFITLNRLQFYLISVHHRKQLCPGLFHELSAPLPTLSLFLSLSSFHILSPTLSNHLVKHIISLQPDRYELKTLLMSTIRNNE